MYIRILYVDVKFCVDAQHKTSNLYNKAESHSLKDMESQNVDNIVLNASAILRACASTSNEGICKPTGMLDRTEIRYWMLHLYFEVFS